MSNKLNIIYDNKIYRLYLVLKSKMCRTPPKSISFQLSDTIYKPTLSYNPGL